MKLINKFFSLFVLFIILNIYGQKTQNVWKDYIDFKNMGIYKKTYFYYNFYILYFDYFIFTFTYMTRTPPHTFK